MAPAFYISSTLYGEYNYASCQSNNLWSSTKARGSKTVLQFARVNGLNRFRIHFISRSRMGGGGRRGYEGQSPREA